MSFNEAISVPKMVPDDRQTVGINVDRHFHVLAAPCLVTKRFDRCIRVKLGTVEVLQEDGSAKTLEVEGTFSRAGLHSLLTDLEAVPDPIGIPDQETVRLSTPYQWAVVMEDGDHVQQYVDGEEVPFASVHLPSVAQFWIIPVHSPNALPWYGLIRGQGFVKRATAMSGNEPMNLPHPGEEPFWFQYYRKNTISFGMGCGGTYPYPIHVVQCLGFKLPRPDGEDVIFEIGIECDGSWQVMRRVPLDHPLWEA